MDIKKVVHVLGILEAACAAKNCDLNSAFVRIDEGDTALAEQFAMFFAAEKIEQARQAEYNRNFLALVEYGNYRTTYVGVTPENFPNEQLGKPTTYRLRPRELPSKFDGYTWKDIQDAVADWSKKGEILGGATMADGLHYGVQQDPEQPNKDWVVCTETQSVDYKGFFLYRVLLQH